MFLVAAATLVAAACGGDDAPEKTEVRSTTGGAVSAWLDDPTEQSWEDLVADAKGSTVSWWLYGGDARINAYIDAHVAPRAKELGVTVKRVPVDDTANAVSKVVSDAQAGKIDDGGAVDLIWINGENFASGKAAKLWLADDWSEQLPNAQRFVDWKDPSINLDLQVPVEGQESPWSRAALVWAHDTSRTKVPPSSLEELAVWATANPGRFTYPAPPDFTGSAFVRYVITQLGEDGAFDYLQELRPFMWRKGQTFPENEAEQNRLFGDGQVDLAMSFDPAFVESAVRAGTFAKTTRPFVPTAGTLTNVSYVTVPRNATHPAAALVLANLLLDPELQAIKADPAVLGIPSVLDPDELPQPTSPAPAPSSPYLLDDLGTAIPELAADQVEPIERRWKQEFAR